MEKHTSNQADASKRKVLPSFRTIEKPGAGEYPAYAHIYIDLLPDDGLILRHLEDNLKSTKKFIASIPKARLLHRYAEGKWTIKEILGHIVAVTDITVLGEGIGTVKYRLTDETKPLRLLGRQFDRDR